MIAPKPEPAAPPKVLKFLDFNPKITDRITLEGRTKYDKFSVLIDRVNKWLSHHPSYDLLSLESVQVSAGEPIPEVSIPLGPQQTDQPLDTFPRTNQTPSNYIRGVRIWLRHNSVRSSAAQQIVRYLTVVPNLRLRGPRAEYSVGGTDELLAAANQHLTIEKIQGRFMAAETFSVYVPADRINPEMCAWSVGGATSQQYVEGLRLFYLVDQNAVLPASLGYVDLIPGSLLGGGDGQPEVSPAMSVIKSGSSGDLEIPAFAIASVGTADRLLAMSAEWQKTHPDTEILRSQTYPIRQTDTKTIAAWPRMIDDVAQATSGLRLIYHTPDSPRPLTILKSELFMPKIGYEVSLMGKSSIRHESQARVLERMAEWARYSEYKDAGFAVCSAETILLVIPIGMLASSASCFWLLRFLRCWWWRRISPSQSVVLKCCQVYYKSTDK